MAIVEHDLQASSKLFIIPPLFNISSYIKQIQKIVTIGANVVVVVVVVRRDF